MSGNADRVEVFAGIQRRRRYSVDQKLAMLAVQDAPRRWPRVHAKYRRYIMRSFPFSVVYFTLPASIEVIAVAHHRRRPGYWLAR